MQLRVLGKTRKGAGILGAEAEGTGLCKSTVLGDVFTVRLQEK